MAELKELNPKDHGNLKVAPNCAIKVAQKQHLINLKVNEIGHAMTSFPVFLTRVSDQSDWAISAITSFEIDSNLFVKDDAWQASYQPTGMQTYPFFLMNSPSEKGQFTMGIDETNPAFNTEDGQSLFEENDKATEYLSQVTAQLQNDIKNEIHSYRFMQKLDELGLIKPMDLLVFYNEGAVNTLKGLHTIDEEKLQTMDISAIDDLRTSGYLGPVYGLLMSIFQLNAMIKRHNEYGDLRRVGQVKLEAPKPSA
ncbi:SapC family protein [Arenicella xantha]|uniref:SapC protein n=1 Tax=Arenicella xantha TaxID=644221 RepID=A0A395JSQ3_9GAMM|nr:SapC family protein [Arenicella xantha]RBP53372.1 SapC protein [Arenicella xantha]